MSRAFVKDDGPDGPPIIPPRTPIPAGVPNYVTPRGLALLKKEKTELESERTRLNTEDIDENERQRELAIVAGRLAGLAERLSSGQLVTPSDQPPDAVRFGTTVTIKDEKGFERHIQIVGVDEADASEGRVAFNAPIARAVIGKKVGESAVIQTPKGEEMRTVTSITSDSE